MAQATAEYQPQAMATTIAISNPSNHSGAGGGTATANRLVKKAAAFGLLRSTIRPRRKARTSFNSRTGTSPTPAEQGRRTDRIMRTPMTIRYAAPASLMS